MEVTKTGGWTTSLFINSREFSLNLLIIFFRLNGPGLFTISFTKILIRKITSCDILVISMDFRHDHCSGSQNIHHPVFSYHFENSKISVLLQSGASLPDGRFAVQNNPTCIYIAFSASVLSREDKIWRKGTFSCCHLAVNMLQWRASCCTEQSPVSMERYRARKNCCCIGRKQISILQSGAWSYIS